MIGFFRRRRHEKSLARIVELEQEVGFRERPNTLRRYGGAGSLWKMSWAMDAANASMRTRKQILEGVPMSPRRRSEATYVEWRDC